MEDQEKYFINGFNAGYLLSKYDSDLLKLLLKANSTNEYLRGLELGKKQHEKEKLLEQVKKSVKQKNRER